MFTGFEPIYDSSCEILILGSFPSVQSRANNFYYGNPQNKFWRTLETCYRDRIEMTLEGKIAYLLSHNIALWDIAKTCEIVGSSDSKLKCIEAVDLEIILNAANIKHVVCNGTKAYHLFMEYYPDLRADCLPSTSPANVRFDIAKWQSAFNKYIAIDSE